MVTTTTLKAKFMPNSSYVLLGQTQTFQTEVRRQKSAVGKSCLLTMAICTGRRGWIIRKCIVKNNTPVSKLKKDYLFRTQEAIKWVYIRYAPPSDGVYVTFIFDIDNQSILSW